MNLSTGCIVYAGFWLEGAIFQPVLQDGTGNLSRPFWHGPGLGSKGECPSCHLKYPSACRKSRSKHGCLPLPKTNNRAGRREVRSTQGVAPGTSHHSQTALWSRERCELRSGCFQPRERDRAVMWGGPQPLTANWESSGKQS